MLSTLTTNLYDLAFEGADETIREIAHQPMCWEKVGAYLDKQPQALYQQIAKQLNSASADIIFCGAGTSAYVGDILADTVQQFAVANVSAIPTTDIVSRPDFYFSAKSEGILFSFARSGNSPESIDTANKVRQIAPNVIQINITCNADGALAKNNDAGTYCCLMPPETHDKSFVMSSSFSTMLLFTYQLIARALGHEEKSFEHIMGFSHELNRELLSHTAIQAIANDKRLVYLGSNALHGAAKEAALKALEMTAGQMVTLSETALGFRHGPKSLVNHDTAVCVFISSHPYTQQFDRDMVLELLSDNTASRVIAVAPCAVAKNLPEHDKLFVIALPESLNGYSDVLLAPLYVQLSQIIGLHLALCFGVSPDNPSPSGEVNRVVEGVTLYPFNG